MCWHRDCKRERERIRAEIMRATREREFKWVETGKKWHFGLNCFHGFLQITAFFNRPVFQLLFSVDQKEEENKKMTLSERAAEKNKPNSQVQNVFFSSFHSINFESSKRICKCRYSLFSTFGNKIFQRLSLTKFYPLTKFVTMFSKF